MFEVHIFSIYFTFFGAGQKKTPILIIMVLVIIGRTADDLKAFLCESNWWDHSFTISESDFIFSFRIIQIEIKTDNLENYLLQKDTQIIYTGMIDR